MDHIGVIQALVRAALVQPSDAVRRQVERLVEALEESGDESSAASLKAILERGNRGVEMVPSRLRRSALSMPGEQLSPRTPVPVDRETSVPLAELLFVEMLPSHPPLFEDALAMAVDSLLEEWRHVEELARMGISPARSCLLYGAPGTGKTKTALWMARELGLPAVSVRLDGLISSFLGTTARNIGLLFGFAARYRCVLLLDEFDAIAKVRDDPQEVGEIKRVVNALLQNLDSRREIGLTIAITNHESLLDPAIWRRFETQIAIPRPSSDVRHSILNAYLLPLELDVGASKLLAWLTEGATGAELEVLARSLKRVQAISGSMRKDLFDALRRFATLNGERLHQSRRDLLFADPRDLALNLATDSELAFSQAELSTLFGCDRSTISRWISGKRDSAITR